MTMTLHLTDLLGLPLALTYDYGERAAIVVDEWDGDWPTRWRLVMTSLVRDGRHVECVDVTSILGQHERERIAEVITDARRERRELDRSMDEERDADDARRERRAS